MSPPIYPANRIRSDGRPRRIRCYKMCSIASGIWCWDATTQAVSDDAPSQRQGWSGVLSFSFKVRVCQGRVTLPCKSSQGVRPPNTFNQRSESIGTRFVGIRRSMGIEWYRFQSVHMVIEVSSIKKADISGDRCPPGSGRV